MTAEDPLPPKVVDVKLAAIAMREGSDGSSDNDVAPVDLRKKPPASKAKEKAKGKASSSATKASSSATKAKQASVAAEQTTPTKSVATKAKKGDKLSQEKHAKPVAEAEPPAQACRVNYFDAVAWGQVKQTVATKKSYIQYWDTEEEKWKCVFSSSHSLNERFSEFLCEQMKEPFMNMEKVKELGTMLKTGEIKLSDNWRDGGIQFGGESADSSMHGSATDID